jgi:hypothetical protein
MRELLTGRSYADIKKMSKQFDPLFRKADEARKKKWADEQAGRIQKM